MSDPNSESSSTPGPPQPPRRPARNMADIARMFLDGARPVSETGAPKRISPKDRAAPPAVQPMAVHQATTSPLPRVMLALTQKDISDKDSAARLAAAAARLAGERRAAVCLLSLRNGTFTIDIFGANSPADLPAIKPTGGLPDVRIARVLFTLRNAAAHWVIAAPGADAPDFPRLAAAVPDWLLVAPAGNEAIVAAYGELKRAMEISSPRNDPRAVLLSADLAHAAVVHTRLRRAVNGFLKKDLPLAAVASPHVPPANRMAEIAVGWLPGDHAAIYAAILDELCGTPADEADAPSDTPEFEDEIVELPQAKDFLPPKPPPASPEDDSRGVSIDIDAPLDSVTAAAVDLALHAENSAAATHALFDQLTSVLDPEERDALNAELPAVAPAPAIPVAEAAAPAAGDPAPAFDNENAPLESPLALRAQDLAGTAAPERAAQWEAVERSIPDLVRHSVLLDACPPMSWANESCLAIDRAGTLHIWILYQAGVSWFALREWAAEHKNLLALTRRDLPLNADAPITVHIVLPLEDSAANPSETSALLRSAAAHLFLYRLRPLLWNSRRGIIVVPLS